MPDFSCLTGTLLDLELGSQDSTVLFTTARRQSAIKQGEAEFADLTECLTRESTITLTGGTAEYDLNSTILNGSTSDFSRLSNRGLAYAYTDASSNVTWVSGVDLVQRDLRWLDQYEAGWRASTGAYTPTIYYLKDEGGRMLLGFYPPPSTGSSASAKAVVPYIAQPSASTASTYLLFTVGTSVRTDLIPYHQAAVHFGASVLEKLRKNYEQSDYQLKKFIGYVTRYLQAKAPKGPRSLTFTRSYLADRRAENVPPNPTWGRSGW